VRKYFVILMTVVFILSIMIGAITAYAKPDPVYCRCECLDGKWYKCCPELVNGEWEIVCKPGCRKLGDCSMPPY